MLTPHCTAYALILSLTWKGTLKLSATRFSCFRVFLVSAVADTADLSVRSSTLRPPGSGAYAGIVACVTKTRSMVQRPCQLALISLHH